MSITTPSSFSGHILGVVAPAWGHLRPLAGLASKIVQERSDIIVTLLVVGDFGLRVEKEINTYFPEDFSECPRCNIRVISLGGEGEGLNILGLSSFLLEKFGAIYSKLANSEIVPCATGKSYSSTLRPGVAIVDPLFLPIIQEIRKINPSGSDVKLLVITTGSATSNLRTMGPEKYGGYENVETKVRELAAATGAITAIEEELFNTVTNAVMKIPGLPSTYAYEWAPQDSPFQVYQAGMAKIIYLSMTMCNGLIAATSAVFEPEANETLQKWLTETNRTFYNLGPLQLRGYGSSTVADCRKRGDLSSSRNGEELLEFLDKTLQTHGPNSLLYISFGSIFWPKEEHIGKLINILLELNFPFILAHGSPMATIPDEVSEKIKSSGIGMHSPWTPQQLILSHPATGWFLTHCGQNGVTEALTRGIPMIAWPIDADQPSNAARLSLTLDVAFELMEIRTGHGLKPLFRGITPKGTIDAVESELYDVLRNAKGPVGDRKRRNAHVLRNAMMSELAEDGDAIKNLRKLLNDSFP